MAFSHPQCAFLLHGNTSPFLGRFSSFFFERIWSSPHSSPLGRTTLHRPYTLILFRATDSGAQECEDRRFECRSYIVRRDHLQVTELVTFHQRARIGIENRRRRNVFISFPSPVLVSQHYQHPNQSHQPPTSLGPTDISKRTLSTPSTTMKVTGVSHHEASLHL